MKKGKVILAMVCSMLIAGGILSSQASDFPTKPITITVPYKAGGGTDIAARTMGIFLQKYLGQPIVVKNFTGAGGQVGWTALAGSKPDGYTIGFINLPAINMAYTVWEKLADYNPIKRFVPIGCNFIDPKTVMVRIDDDRFKTIKDLIEYAHKNPGKVVGGAYGGWLSDGWLSLVKMKKATGVKFSFASFPRLVPAHAALLGRQVDFIVTSTSAVIKYKDKARSLVQFWKERHPMIPHIPTFKEVFGKEVIGVYARGIVAPAGIPEDRLNVLREAFQKAANDMGFQNKAKKVGLPLALLDAKGFGEFIKATQENVYGLMVKCGPPPGNPTPIRPPRPKLNPIKK